MRRQLSSRRRQQDPWAIPPRCVRYEIEQRIMSIEAGSTGPKMAPMAQRKDSVALRSFLMSEK